MMGSWKYIYIDQDEKYNGQVSDVAHRPRVAMMWKSHSYAPSLLFCLCIL